MAEDTMERAAAHSADIRAGYEAFARGDIAEVTKSFDPNIRWHLLRPGALGGDHIGMNAVVAFFKELGTRSAGTFRMEVRDILASETQAAVDVRIMARRDDKTLDTRQIHLFRYEGDRIVEVWQFVDDAQANAEFWT